MNLKGCGKKGKNFRGMKIEKRYCIENKCEEKLGGVKGGIK